MAKRPKKPRTLQAAEVERRRKAAAEAAPTHERLQKILARSGYGSRRACEDLIAGGRVRINGEVAAELGAKADPTQDTIEVDGKTIRVETTVYYLLNKPKNVLCTSSDPQGRRTVFELLPQESKRTFSVGRLDYESRGALILTNDGEFSNLLTHPRYGIEKTYSVRVRGEVQEADLVRLRGGIWLSEGRTLPAKVWVVKRRKDETELGLTICEGKNRQVRRMFAKIGAKVLGLTRTRIGNLNLRGLKDGESRPLEPKEVDSLRRLAQQNTAAPRPQGPGHRGTRAKSLGKPDPAAHTGGFDHEG
ncbi:MAG: pseudouridine synthase [Planctomycetota bacterium]